MIKKFTQSLPMVSALRIKTGSFRFALPLLMLQMLQAQSSTTLNYASFACNDPYVSIGTTTGATKIGAGNDVTFLNQTLPFTFQYYGVDYTQYMVGTNGFMAFNPATAADWATPLCRLLLPALACTPSGTTWTLTLLSIPTAVSGFVPMVLRLTVRSLSVVPNRPLQP